MDMLFRRSGNTERHGCRVTRNRRMRIRTILAVLAIALTAVLPTEAQWLNLPSKGLPRTPDGKVDMNAPAPRMPDGKADLRGIWMLQGRFIFNIASGMKPDDIPYQPWAKALYDSRLANESIDDPVGHCIPAGVPRADVVPYPWKLLQLPDDRHPL
jgi:hypothetical protein